WSGASWTAVARRATTPNPRGVENLYGSWAPIPAMPDGNGENVGQVKLWLWSKSAFDYTRHSGRSWEDWFTGRFDGYPCPPPLRSRTVCCDFEDIDLETPLTAPWTCHDVPEMRLIWSQPKVQYVALLSAAVERKTHALCFDQPGPISDWGPTLFIAFEVSVQKVRILVTEERTGVTAIGIDEIGN